MQYRILGKSGISVSELCLGTMNFAGPTDESHAQRIVHRAIDAGVNFIGCSNFYAWQVMEGLAASRARNLSEFVCTQPMYDALVPRGEHTGKGYNDPQYPVRGRVLA